MIFSPSLAAGSIVACPRRLPLLAQGTDTRLRYCMQSCSSKVTLTERSVRKVYCPRSVPARSVVIGGSPGEEGVAQTGYRAGRFAGGCAVAALLAGAAPPAVADGVDADHVSGVVCTEAEPLLTLADLAPDNDARALTAYLRDDLPRTGKCGNLARPVAATFGSVEGRFTLGDRLYRIMEATIDETGRTVYALVRIHTDR